MASIDGIISTIETRWTEVAMTLIPQTAEQHDLDEVYVAAFWLFYVDYSAFYPPYLSINTEKRCRKDRDSGHHYRWSPAEWEFGLDDATDTMADEYEPLMEALTDQSEEEWNSAIEAHHRATSRVCRNLTTAIRASGSSRFSGTFVAGIFEERESEAEFERLVHLSIDESTLDQLPEPTWKNSPPKR